MRSISWLACAIVILGVGCKEDPPRARIKSIEKLPPSPAPRPLRRRYTEQVKHDPAHVLGGEQGVDHVGVAVKDLDGARAAYEKLGFANGQAGRLPNGLKNVNFYFGDTTYLELVTTWDAKKNPWVASFIERNEKGAMFLMLCVFSYTHSANFLRRKGFKVSDPFPGRIETGGAPGPGRPARGRAPTWVTFHLDGEPLPGNVTFIAYTRRLRSFMLTKLKDDKLRRKLGHPNTVLGLRSGWIAVPVVARAQKIFEGLGLEAGRPVEVKELEAKGVEIKAGQGTLVLLEPRRAGKGPTAAFLKRRGQGLIGLGFEVESLETARAYIKTHAGLDLPTAEGRLLVPAEKAYGVWLELRGQAPSSSSSK